MPYSHLTLACEGSTAIVTLNRPAQRNALSLALMHEVIDCLRELEERATPDQSSWPPLGRRFAPDMTCAR